MSVVLLGELPAASTLRVQAMKADTNRPDANSIVPSAILVNEPTAALMLAISARTLWALRARGVIPCVRINKSVRYRVSDIESFVANLSTTNTSNQ